MKQIILLVMVLFLVSCSSSMRFLPEPCANPEIDSQELSDYFYLYDSIIDYNQQAGPNETNAVQNPLYIEYYQQLLEPEIIKCDFTITTEVNGLKTTHKGVIYFSRGYLYIHHFGTLQEGLSFDPYQYVTQANGVYSWKQGDSRGKVFKRIPGDTLTFLTFYIDPKAVMRNLFWTSRENLLNFSQSQKGELKTLHFLDNQSPYLSFSYFENPLWLTKCDFLQGDTLVHFSISRPQKVNCIPQSVAKIPENIEWEYSEQSITSRQYYH
jgi:hypothetical protein